MRIATPILRSLAVTIVVLGAGTADARQGNLIRAKDGDTILVEGDARIRVVRRRTGLVRTIFNAEQRWLIVLADYPDRTGATDGRVDAAMNFREIGGDWPIEPRWEGQASIEEYVTDGRAREGVGLRLPLGLIQLLSTAPPTVTSTFKDPSAIAVLSHRGAGTSGSGMPGTGRFSFDEEEPRAIASVSSSGQGYTSIQGGVTSSVEMRSGAAQPFSQAVRVGSTVRTPQRTHYVDPVLPELARQANVRGIVIVEAVIDADGSVKQARVLRSIPLLDDAALEAVRQWRFEPTQLNGQAVPVIMTLTVNFQ